VTDQPAPKPRRMSYRQKRWLEAYLRTWNATEAARQAGYKDPNATGPKQLTFDYVRTAIDARLKEVAMSANEILARLSQHASVNIADFVSVETGQYDSVQTVKLNLDEFKRRGYLIKKVSNTQYGIVLEVVDNQAALVHLGRHLKLFADQVELTGKDGGPIQHEDVGLSDNERADRIAALLAEAQKRLPKEGDGQ
jgi:phage terminase small subunit